MDKQPLSCQLQEIEKNQDLERLEELVKSKEEKKVFQIMASQIRHLTQKLQFQEQSYSDTIKFIQNEHSKNMIENQQILFELRKEIIEQKIQSEKLQLQLLKENSMLKQTIEEMEEAYQQKISKIFQEMEKEVDIEFNQFSKNQEILLVFLIFSFFSYILLCQILIDISSPIINLQYGGKSLKKYQPKC